MSKNVVDIPDDVVEIMEYLSNSFAKSMHDPVNSNKDLFNDMVVLYLENKDKGIFKKNKDKNYWFTFLKSRMINKYNRIIKERQIIDTLKYESR